MRSRSVSSALWSPVQEPQLTPGPSASSGAAQNIEDLGLKLVFRLFCAPLGPRELRTDRPGELSKWATASIWTASFASCFNLLLSSHIGFRCLRVQLGSGNLPLVPLSESLVHRPTLQHSADAATAVEPGGFVSCQTRRRSASAASCAERKVWIISTNEGHELASNQPARRAPRR